MYGLLALRSSACALILRTGLAACALVSRGSRPVLQPAKALFRLIPDMNLVFSHVLQVDRWCQCKDFGFISTQIVGRR